MELDTKVDYIIHQVEKDIRSRIYFKGQQLLSLTEVQHKYNVSRDTANKAYRDLLKRGVIESRKGKGYYVLNDTNCFNINVFLLLDELSDYKNRLVKSIGQSLGVQASYKVFFHHFDEEIFSSLIHQNIGKFTHYVISPFPSSKVVEDVLKKIPSDDLMLLDRHDGNFENYQFVGQEYELDIKQCLSEIKKSVEKYGKLIFIFPEPSTHPIELKKGFKVFCEQQNIAYEIASTFDKTKIKTRDAYLVIDDNDLADILEAIREKELVLGKDIGLIAYNDTRLKAAIGITTISTDFIEMGEKLADLIFKRTTKKSIRNKAYLFKRASF